MNLCGRAGKLDIRGFYEFLNDLGEKETILGQQAWALGLLEIVSKGRYGEGKARILIGQVQ